MGPAGAGPIAWLWKVLSTGCGRAWRACCWVRGLAYMLRVGSVFGQAASKRSGAPGQAQRTVAFSLAGGGVR